jgi:hypothetical protein
MGKVWRDTSARERAYKLSSSPFFLFIRAAFMNGREEDESEQEKKVNENCFQHVLPFFTEAEAVSVPFFALSFSRYAQSLGKDCHCGGDNRMAERAIMREFKTNGRAAH